MYGYIYETTNLINGKKYIGKHKSEKFDSSYLGSGVRLKKALNKYGKENFNVKVIEIIETNQYDLDLEEMYWIKYFNAIKSRNYYNNSAGGKEEGWNGYHLAIKEKGGIPQETILKQKNAAKDRVWINKNNIDKHIKKIELQKYLNNGWKKGRSYGIPLKGEKHFLYGKKMSAESRKKISQSHKGKIPWNKGKHNVYSEETLERLRKSHKGKILSDETKRKQSEALKGEKAYWFGKSLPNETKRKIGKKNSSKKMINNGIQNKKVPLQELEGYLSQGWSLGMIRKKYQKRDLTQ